jgi:putative oxidoreductase
MNHPLFTVVPSLQFFFMMFIAICFLQSAVDKLTDWKGNLEWLKSHFANSPLKGQVPWMLLLVTFAELASGLIAIVAIICLLLDMPESSKTFGILSSQLATTSILMLFFGQRMAKDYVGASTLVSYFIVCIFSLWIFS